MDKTKFVTDARNIINTKHIDDKNPIFFDHRISLLFSRYRDMIKRDVLRMAGEELLYIESTIEGDLDEYLNSEFDRNFDLPPELKEQLAHIAIINYNEMIDEIYRLFKEVVIGSFNSEWDIGYELQDQSLKYEHAKVWVRMEQGVEDDELIIDKYNELFPDENMNKQLLERIKASKIRITYSN